MWPCRPKPSYILEAFTQVLAQTNSNKITTIPDGGFHLYLHTRLPCQNQAYILAFDKCCCNKTNLRIRR